MAFEYNGSMLVWGIILEDTFSKKKIYFLSNSIFGIIRDSFLEEDAELRKLIWALLWKKIKVFFWTVIWAVLKLFYYFVMAFMPLDIFLFFSNSFMEFNLTVNTIFKVGSLYDNGHLCHLLNVNKYIYDFFLWKKDHLIFLKLLSNFN